MEALFKKVSKILYNDIFNDKDINTSTKRQIKMQNHRGNSNKKKCC